ncbi:non-ribosomal peptide synthetase, partial [uncultured Aquimarina sp.]|uniref:non-ribosomal peptide synthetase n=1 Tax=uncultured Aquimarina sp. TaxID=575652 RepID=UPI0026289D56
SFDTFYRKIKDNTLKSYGHQEYPFDKLTEELAVLKDIGRGTLFDIMLVLHNTKEFANNKSLNIDELAVIADQGKCASKLDINIHFQEIGNRLKHTIIYNTDVYEYPMIEALMKHFEGLLSELLLFPSLQIDTVGYVKNEEKSMLLNEFNQTQFSFPLEKTIINLFEEQVEKQPNNIAVVIDNNQQINYKKFNELSNIIATFILEEYGLGEKEIVAIELSNRPDMTLIAMLGVLKSGRAYVLIDATLPQSRIDFILEDSNCIHFLRTDDIQRIVSLSNNYNTINPGLNIKASSLAYVIYTSGTTGTPKGVQIKHESIVNYVSWFSEKHKITSNDRTVITSSIAYDLIYTSLYGGLLNGCQIHFLDNLNLKNPVKVSKYIEEKSITFLKLTPTYLNLLLHNVGEHTIIKSKSLRLILTGGERQNLEDVKNLVINSDIQLVNHYGPSEGTIGVCTYQITRNNLQDYLSNPVIGNPIFNTEIYILGDNQELQPKGMMGEICIGGIGLSTGYLNRLELTAEKFIENPYKKGNYIYKTGDLGRRLPDGTIEFIGRKDDQVKIRGYRIELGEIEKHLENKEDIVNAVVLVNEEKEKELIAYIVSKQKENVTDIRRYLSKELPGFMMPDHYMQLDDIPLTANGKVDRKLIPSLNGIKLSGIEEYVLPTNKEETIILKIWTQVLERNKISIRDSFFDLGGNSIKAIKILHKINQEFGTNISIGSLFNYPTIEYIAIQINIAKKQESILNTGKKLKEIEL